ncbi:hypothetical protein SISNIDRAFT_327564 [Sistotremastrum niveocremeum HHB9708]|uniref:C3H1-type domain-containing protein n=2 Tax=Sistotremastraceae TaxID=3402574 RepID=A0A164XC45_9AGAM
MVSLLWKAAADGDLARVHEALSEPAGTDIEIKDLNGETPLIQAIKGGHVQVVQALLARGADPNNGSSRGRPETYTADPAILQALQTPQGPPLPNGASHASYGPEGYAYAPAPYYGQHVAYGTPYAYMPAPGNGNMVPYGYYPPPPQQAPSGEQQPQEQSPQPVQPSIDQAAQGNLPPPEVARTIPCRFYPACRYGPACYFAHPQAPYFPGPLPPPAQYSNAPYDPTSNPQYAPGYYPMSPTYGPSAPPSQVMSPVPNGQPPLLGHSRSPTELISPINGAFPPNVQAQPLPPPPIPAHYAPVSPPYTNGHHVPHPPTIVPMPPPPSNPQSPTVYPVVSPVLAGVPYPQQRRESISNFSQGPMSPINSLGPSQIQRSPPRPDGESFGQNGVPRDQQRPNNRGNPRRIGHPHGSHGSFGKKPACLFFPTGRCRNGDQCRFPHVMPEPGAQVNGAFSVRYPTRSRPAPPPTLEDKMAGLTVRETNGASTNGDGSSEHDPADPATQQQARFPNSTRQLVNGAGRTEKRNNPSIKQRIPNADDFPTLQGNKTPPLTNGHVNGHFSNGPTVAQVLQAATAKSQAAKSDTSEKDGFRRPAQLKAGHSITESNGDTSTPYSSDSAEPKSPVPQQVHVTA